MSQFFDLFIGHPVVLLVIASAFLAGYVGSRNRPRLRAKALLMPALLWLLWAVWEWSILRFTPEANIRVDLFLILPVVFLGSIAGIVILLLKRKP